MFLHFALLLYFTEGTPLQDTYIHKMGFVGQNGDNVLCSVVGTMKPELLHYSFQANRVRIVEDGRMPMMLPYILPYESGFVLFSTLGNGTLYFVSGDGTFQDSVRLDGVFAVDEKVTFVQPSDTGVLLTIRQGATWKLTRFDIEERKAEHLFSYKASDEHMRTYCALGDQYWMVTRETGEIAALDKQGRKGPMIHKGQEPLARKKFQRRGRFHRILGQYHSHNGFLAFSHRQVRDPYGNPLEPFQKNCLILDQQGLVQFTESIVLAMHGEKALTLHEPSGELTIQPTHALGFQVP